MKNIKKKLHVNDQSDSIPILVSADQKEHYDIRFDFDISDL